MRRARLRAVSAAQVRKKMEARKSFSAKRGTGARPQRHSGAVKMSQLPSTSSMPMK
jgi:hypothetical protein